MAYSPSSHVIPNLSGGSGSINDGENIGAGEGQVFKIKVGDKLQFKTLKQGANVTITNNVDEILIEATDTGEINTGANVGIGEGLVFRDKTGTILNFKKLQAGANIIITNNADEIIISSIGGGGSTDIKPITVNVSNRAKDFKINVVDATVLATSQILVNWGNLSNIEQNHPSLSEVEFNISNIQIGSFDLELYAKNKESLFGNYKLNYLVG